MVQPMSVATEADAAALTSAYCVILPVAVSAVPATASSTARAVAIFLAVATSFAEVPQAFAAVSRAVRAVATPESV